MTDYGYDALVETLWKDLDGQVARHQIAQEVSEVAARFEDATVTAYVPIFIRWKALELLRSELPGESHPIASTATTGSMVQPEEGNGGHQEPVTVPS